MDSSDRDAMATGTRGSDSLSVQHNTSCTSWCLLAEWFISGLRPVADSYLMTVGGPRVDIAARNQLIETVELKCLWHH